MRQWVFITETYAMERLHLYVSLLMSTRLTRLDAIVAFGRELAMCLSLPLNPIGTGNSKTGTASTYRPVGASCPACPFEKTCYALRGFVAVHQSRASVDLTASLTTSALAMVAAHKAGTLARLHVAGDFAADGQLDTEYIYGLAELGQALHRKMNSTAPLAWSYTHHQPEEFESYRLILKGAGIEVLYSGSFAPGGAVLWPFEELGVLRRAHPEHTFVKCRFDLDGTTTCRECQLCPNAWRDELTIVFDPTGGAVVDTSITEPVQATARP